MGGFALAVLSLSVLVLRQTPGMAQTYADMLGIAMTCLASVQWLPQVYTTWHLGHLGSLSVVALCLQTPVSFDCASIPSRRACMDALGSH